MNEIVNWYICGPTVYDESHLGHARTYVTMDIHRRILEDILGYDVNLLMNITDIDDKIINKAFNENVKFNTIATKYEKLFFKSMYNMNIKPLPNITHVSHYIDDIIVVILKIISNGYAYVSNGSVYLNIKKYLDAGFKYKLRPNIKINEEKLDDNSDKLNNEDFALWKKSEDVGWKNPFSEHIGRPGWHIECTTMIIKYFVSNGGRLDIHSGGIDLAFPHHENELIQATAYFNEEGWVKKFMHYGSLLDKNGKKMSKSLGNYITIDHELQHVNDFSNVFRMFILTHDYKSQLEYKEESLSQARNDLYYITDFLIKIDSISNINNGKQQMMISDKNLLLSLSSYKSRIRIHLENDFNTKLVINELKDIVTHMAPYISFNDICNYGVLLKYKTYIENLLIQFGISFDKPKYNFEQDNLINDVVDFRTKIRKLAISNKYFELMPLLDEFRDETMKKYDIEIEDISKDKSIWKKS